MIRTKKVKHTTTGVPINIPREGTQSPEPPQPIRERQQTGKAPFSFVATNTSDPAMLLPEWASAMQKQVTQHDNLFEIIKNQQEKLAKQQEQLDRQQRFSDQQQHLLTELIATIKDLQATVQTLRDQPTQATTSAPSSQQPTTQSTPKGTQDSIWAQARVQAPKIFESPQAKTKQINAAPRRMPPSRFFSAPPTERSNYTMTYLQVRHRCTQRQVREQLRDIKVNSARILDITMPASGVVGLLHHSDFGTELKSTLTTNEITVIDFDPRSPASIRDPKLTALSTEQKERVARHLHNATCLKGLAGMPANIRRSVAHDYFAKGYINSAQYDYHLGKASSEEVRDTLNPATVAALVASFSEDDQEMSPSSPSSSNHHSAPAEST
jgi:hypothetical protein